MWFGAAFTLPSLAGFPWARVGWRAPASAAAWMRPSPRTALPGNFAWQRALAYRGDSRTAPGAAQWRAQFDALAQRSLRKFQQTVPGAAKLANPGAMQAILRDLQNARVSRNDMQVRAKAAELRIITAYLRRPDVASVRVVPSSSAGRTPDLVVGYRGGRAPERVEVRAMTGSTPGWRRASVLARGRLPNADGSLRSGMFAKARITLKDKPTALVVPEEAILPIGSDNFVYRIDNGKAMRTKVQTGMRKSGRVEIVSGLEVGDLVVTAGQLKLPRDGLEVRVIEPSRRPPAAPPAPAPKPAG